MSKKDRRQRSDEAPNVAAPISTTPSFDSNAILRRAISKTSKAVWLTGLPTLTFLGFFSYFLLHDPQLKAAIAANALDAQLTKWLYFSYFSVASITLFKMYDDYGAELMRRKLLFAIYLLSFLTFANTFLAALLEEATSWKDGGQPITATTTMALTYVLAVVGLFAYLLLREAELAIKSSATSAAPPSGNMEARTPTNSLWSALSQFRSYVVPMVAAITLATLMTFGLPKDSPTALFLFSVANFAALTFPAYFHFFPK